MSIGNFWKFIKINLPRTGVGGRSEKEAVVVVVEDDEEVVAEEVVEVVLVVEAVEVKRKRDPKFSLRRRPGSAKTKWEKEEE